MTNYFENLDEILAQYRFNYLRAYALMQYVTAADLLYARNAAHPPDAWLSDMPNFTIRSNNLKTKLNINQKAKQYCDHWNPKLEMAMAQFRHENQAAYNQL